MKTLNIGDTYKHQQGIFTIIKRTDNVVMAFDGVGIWEVFRIRNRKAKELPSGAIMEAGEYPPGSEMFGNMARCHTVLKNAEKSFAEFVEICQKSVTPMAI